MPPQDDIVDDKQQILSSNTHDRNITEASDQQGNAADEGSMQREYTVDTFVKNVGNGRKWKYVLRRYGYTSQNDNIEPL